MMYMGDEFSRVELFEDFEWSVRLEKEEMESLLESGILQPEDLVYVP